MCLKTNEYISSVIASGKFANVADLIEFAKSNNHKEAFIIGNSTGLRQITDERWERVKNGFSIGFNSIPLFENFAPNVWMFEISNFWLSHIAQDIFKSAETRLDCVENFFLIKDTFCTEINACKAVIPFAEKIKRAKEEGRKNTAQVAVKTAVPPEIANRGGGPSKEIPPANSGGPVAAEGTTPG